MTVNASPVVRVRRDLALERRQAGALLTMITAAAPACWPKIALRHAGARAAVDDRDLVRAERAAEVGDGEQPSDSSAGVAGLSVITTIVAGRPVGVGVPFALIAVDRERPFGSVIARAGKPRDGSLAAVAIAPSAVPGEPVMYWFGPLLPAEVTTITPALAAFVEATADGSSLEPNGEPSDMLITSMSFSTAHSIASTVTSVEPRSRRRGSPYRSAFGATPGPIVHELPEIVVALYGPV